MGMVDFNIDDLQERGQVYLPQGLVRKHQEELQAQMAYQSSKRGSSSEDTEHIPEGKGKG